MDKNYSTIQKVKQHDDSSFNDILAKYERLIYYIIAKYNIESGDYSMSKDDLFQEGCLALYDACLKYDNNQAASFSTFAYTIIKRRLDNCMHKFYKSISKEYISVDKVGEVDYLSYYTTWHYETIDAKYDYEKRIRTANQFLTRLSARDAEILKLRQDKKSYADIAQLLNISKKQIDNRLTAMKKEYRKLLNKND